VALRISEVNSSASRLLPMLLIQWATFLKISRVNFMDVFVESDFRFVSMASDFPRRILQSNSNIAQQD
jgi:hypothetical protein